MTSKDFFGFERSAIKVNATASSSADFSAAYPQISVHITPVMQADGETYTGTASDLDIAINTTKQEFTMHGSNTPIEWGTGHTELYIKTLDDNEGEPDETFEIQLQNVQCYCNFSTLPFISDSVVKRALSKTAPSWKCAKYRKLLHAMHENQAPRPHLL